MFFVVRYEACLSAVLPPNNFLSNLRKHLPHLKANVWFLWLCSFCFIYLRVTAAAAHFIKWGWMAQDKLLNIKKKITRTELKYFLSFALPDRFTLNLNIGCIQNGFFFSLFFYIFTDNQIPFCSTLFNSSLHSEYKLNIGYILCGHRSLQIYLIHAQVAFSVFILN